MENGSCCTWVGEDGFVDRKSGYRSKNRCKLRSLHSLRRLFLSCCWRRWVVVRCIAYPLRNTERRFWSYNVKSWSFVIPHRNHFLKEKEKRLNQLQAYNSLNARYFLFSLDCYSIDWVSVGNALLLDTCICAHVSCVVITVFMLLLLTPAISSVSCYLHPFLSVLYFSPFSSV